MFGRTIKIFPKSLWRNSMAIDETDIKKLWGLAAGRCSAPDCDVDCVLWLDSEDPTIIGEMAHVIAKKPGGPRGASGGKDIYANLILLCPTHHTIVDKAPHLYPVKLLLKWKADHEARIASALSAPVISSKKELCAAIARLLAENRLAWKTSGPESREATENPLSSMAKIWEFKKINKLVPNNRKIINLLKDNQKYFDGKEYPVCCAFIEHAEGFEANCYVRREGVKRFPQKFNALVMKYA